MFNKIYVPNIIIKKNKPKTVANKIYPVDPSLTG